MQKMSELLKYEIFWFIHKAFVGAFTNFRICDLVIKEEKDIDPIL